MTKFSVKWRLSDLPSPSANAPTVFSCFSCGGGSSMGYKRAGFRVIGNLEIDPKINKIYNEQLHPEFSFCEDIRAFAVRETYPDALYDLDVLDGSPPCTTTTFSMAGLREKVWGKTKKFAEGQAEQRLDDLFFEFIAVAKRLRPLVVVAENVPGILIGNAKVYTKYILQHFRDAGYIVDVHELDARYADVPQCRKRVFFIGRRNDIPLGFLRIQFNRPQIPFGLVRSMTPGHIPSPESKTAILLGALRTSDRGLCDASIRLTGKASFFNLKICWDNEVAPTLLNSGRHIRAFDKSFLSDQDLISCSTFPEEYLSYRSSQIQFLTGMCVPPNLAAHIATEIRNQWLRH